MIENKLLEILRCPQDRSKLSQADIQLVMRINRAIDAYGLVNVGGHPLKKHIEGGLVREAGDRLYPIIDQIPVMLPDEAIDLSQLKSNG